MRRAEFIEASIFGASITLPDWDRRGGKWSFR